MSETKYCINCGKAIPTNATFCPFCGATQDKVASTEDQNTITSEQHNTPNQPEHVNMWTALKLGMRQTFTWSQRITRPQYWWLYLDLVLISLVLTIVLGIRAYSYPAFILSPLHVNVLQTVLLLIFSALMVWTSVMQFTASARRLHDSNRSAHYLWFYLLPLVGPILIIVFLCQRSEPAGKRFDRLASQPKPWTHKWWTWCLLVLLTLGYAALINITARDTAMDAALTTTSSQLQLTLTTVTAIATVKNLVIARTLTQIQNQIQTLTVSRLAMTTSISPIKKLTVPHLPTVAGRNPHLKSIKSRSTKRTALILAVAVMTRKILTAS